jgi:zinc protease
VQATLPNGAMVTTRQTRKTPAVTINLAVRAGTSQDPSDGWGTMYLLSRVLDRGTTTRTAEQMGEALDNRGTSLNVYVNRHQTTIACTCLAEHFDVTLALLGDMVMAPACPDAEVEMRRRQVLTGIRQDADAPAARAVERLMALLYGPEHPYGRPMKGTTGSVEALSRQQLVNAHARTFGPSALSLVVVGDVEPSRVLQSAASVFGEWPAHPLAPESLPPIAPATVRRQDVVSMMNKAQADIAYGFTAISRDDPGYYAFWLMNNILGQYALGGRLGDSIRERQGMAYYCSTVFEPSIVPGPLMVRAGVAAANVERAVASIDHELRSIRSEGVTEKELTESRQYLIGSMPRALETNAGIAQFLQNAVFFGLGTDYDQRLPSLLRAVKRDDVHAATTLLDPDRATVVVAGPYAA